MNSEKHRFRITAKSTIDKIINQSNIPENAKQIKRRCLIMPEKTRFDKLEVLDKFKYMDDSFIKIKRCTYKVNIKGFYKWNLANSINLKTGRFEWFNNSNKIELEG